MRDTKTQLFPESHAGGYTRMDGTVAFYMRVNALLSPDAIVLDFGAGRGMGIQEDPAPYRRALRTLKGKCRKVIGVDVDEAVLTNPGLDEAFVIKPGEPLPLPDESIDLIVSDNTFEHITDPAPVAKELTRVLKPGGWICARTPNKWGYIALGATIIPNRLHTAVLRRLQPHRKAIDVFPTAYKLNTPRALRRYFPKECFSDHSYTHFDEPSYFGKSATLWRLALASSRVLPAAAAPTRFVFLRKRTS